VTKAPEKINASLTAVKDGWYQLVNVKSGQRAFPITAYTRTDVADAQTAVKDARIAELELALQLTVDGGEYDADDGMREFWDTEGGHYGSM
jgi:hypothetical protein